MPKSTEEEEFEDEEEAFMVLICKEVKKQVSQRISGIFFGNYRFQIESGRRFGAPENKLVLETGNSTNLLHTRQNLGFPGPV